MRGKGRRRVTGLHLVDRMVIISPKPSVKSCSKKRKPAMDMTDVLDIMDVLAC